MDIHLSINHNRIFGFGTEWRLFGRHHGKPESMDGGTRVHFFYGWFYYSRWSNPADELLYYIKQDRLKDYLDFNGCINIDDFILKNKQWIGKRQLKKIRKYQRKLEKILDYRKAYKVTA